MSSSRTGSSLDRHRPQKFAKEKTHNDPLLDDHEALCRATDAVLRKVITTDEHFADLPADCTLEELQAEIALARGLATTIYVKRDGLPTLKVVLSQPNPTIANLKRAIERTTNLLQQRRKAAPSQLHHSDRGKATEPVAKKSSTDTPPRRSGELIAAAPTRAERQHRAKPSWRFLWRAYALSKVQDIELTTPSPLPDANGRQLLSDFGIGHKSVLRFVKRENYFGRRRQRS